MVHCCAHRVALAASQSADKIPYLKKFKRQLSSLFAYFHQSPLRTAELQEMQRLLEDPELRLKKVADTRWLSHAVSTIRRTLYSLIAYLENQASEGGCPTAYGLAKALKSYNFVATLYFLSDVLPQLSKLSLVFQAASVDFSLIKPQVSVTIATIKRFKTVSGPFYKTVDEALKQLDIHFTPENKEAFEHQIAHKYVDTVVSNLEDRFPDTKLLSAFSVFDPQQVPQENKAEFGTYGNEHIDTLSDNFQLTIDKETLEIEWLSFKEMLKNQVAELSTTEVMHSLIKPSVSIIYPQLAKLANIGLIIPVSTATCERGFSAMKRIKTNLRNRLIAKTLDCLMRISIDGPDLDCFDFVTAATKWASIKKRRITI